MTVAPGTVQPFGYQAGYQRPLRGTNPAAGASWSITLPGFNKSTLVSMVFTLTTSAVAANRFVTVEYQGDDGNAFAVAGAGAVVTASSTQRFVGALGRGQAEWATNTDVFFPLVPIYSEPGWTLAINVAAIDATDTLTKIRFVLDQFPTLPV